MPASREGPMPIELQLLVWSAALTLLQCLIAVTGAMLQVGLPTLAGNREKMPEIIGWAGRAARAHGNMPPSPVLFAPLGLGAEATGQPHARTALRPHPFFWGRIAYALVYMAGVPWLRTAVWTVSIIGLVLIFAQLV